MKKNRVSFISLLLAVMMLLSSVSVPFASEKAAAGDRTELTPDFGMPSTFPNVGEHPRVLLRASDFPDIRKNLEGSEGAAAARELDKLLAQETDGILLDKLTGVGSNMDYNVFAIVEAYAFDYLINGNEENGQKAVTAMKNIIETFQYNPKKSDVVREKGVVIYLSALIYDWCYPLMTAEDKKMFVDNTETLAKTITGMGGWPMTEVYAVHGHNSETHILRDLLAFSIACYDEYPDIYNLVAGYVMNGLVETKNWWYQSHTFHQGLGYNPLRFSCELLSEFLFLRMNGTKLYSDDMGQVPYMNFYLNRPDGRSFPEGDTNGDSLTDKIPTWKRGDMTHLLYASSIWDDAYLKGEYMRYSNNNYSFFSYKSYWPLLTPTQFLIVNDPNVGTLPKENMPKTRMFGSPNGLMVARTGLNEGVEQSDVIVWGKIGETYVGNHAHLDSGSFQIYYKGPLAWDTGRYDSFGSAHDANYAKETIAHNSLLIYDPDEVMISKTSLPVPKNSGGQQRRGPETKTFEQVTGEDCHMADILGMEFGEDPVNPEYSYISGDLTAGYSDKVSEVRRSMLFMPTGMEDKPAIFVVMDKIIASDPDFKKTFLIHSLQEPEVDGNVTVIKRDTIGYNGKLTMQTLYPQNPVIEKVGGLGKQFWVVDENIPPVGGKYYSDYDSTKSSEHGWGRVEISPSKALQKDYFLNVMYVSDADNLSPVDEAVLIETDHLLGARIFNQVTLFGKDTERISSSLSFTIPGEGEVAATVSGISSGEWTITGENGNVQKKIATEEGGIIYFEAPAGTYTIQLTNPEAVRP